MILPGLPPSGASQQVSPVLLPSFLGHSLVLHPRPTSSSTNTNSFPPLTHASPFTITLQFSFPSLRSPFHIFFYHFLLLSHLLSSVTVTHNLIFLPLKSHLVLLVSLLPVQPLSLTHLFPPLSHSLSSLTITHILTL